MLLLKFFAIVTCLFVNKFHLGLFICVVHRLLNWVLLVLIYKYCFAAVQNAILEWKAKKEKLANKDSDEEEEEEDIYAVVEVAIYYN